LTRVAPEVWSRLGESESLGLTLLARRATPEVSDRLIAAIDAERQRHFLVLLTAAEEGLENNDSRGVTVTTRELAVPGHDPGRYLDVVCHDPTAYDAFDVIGGEVAERLADGGEHASRSVAIVLARWRRFWGNIPRDLLTREQRLGLFGELWFLCHWLAPRVGPHEATLAWRGPLGARHDFERPLMSIEVKATTSTRGRIHRISSLDQLSDPEHGELTFFSLGLREERGAVNSLPSLVDSCTQAFEGEPDSLARFEGLLAEAGYSSRHAAEYGEVRWRVSGEALYRVRLGFPRLMRSSFSDGALTNVEAVSYEINLAGCDPLIIATTPSATFDL
jgi:hypothetical protein